VAVLLVPLAFGGNATRSSKKGLVIPPGVNHHCGDFAAFKTISWWYHYKTHPDIHDIKPTWCTCPEDGNTDSCLPDSSQELDFVPMIWGVNGYGHQPNLNYDNVTEEGRYLLGYNEPNKEDQSGMPPQVAAEAWIELQEKYPDKLLVSPATAGANKPWMDEFWDRCKALGCRIDYIATHKYSGDTDQVMSILEEYSRRYDNTPLWLTEFAVNNEHDPAVITAYVEEVLPRLEAADFIYRYSWFISRHTPKHEETGNWWMDSANGLLEYEASKLTAVGRAYDVAYHQYL